MSDPGLALGAGFNSGPQGGTAVSQDEAPERSLLLSEQWPAPPSSSRIDRRRSWTALKTQTGGMRIWGKHAAGNVRHHEGNQGLLCPNQVWSATVNRGWHEWRMNVEPVAGQPDPHRPGIVFRGPDTRTPPLMAQAALQQSRDERGMNWRRPGTLA